ncbi:MAG TPA: potassium channel family protein [Polynucleobacter sp.]|nr:potassium channel family protein [Polynucleobacter sp.]HQS60557.1 potassium channel family protein [Polynucleobacter sp.]HQT19802.1 potassium channel family protein [Polynucleobacter sp.]HQT40803.1 potassium channel family protein [Polynucleobacter sp.]
MLLTFAFIANSLLALIAILLHYEVLFQLDKYLPKVAHIAPRFKVLLSVGVIFLAHVLEIWIFALGYYATLQFPLMGSLVGEISGHGALLDCAYLSFITYTTVGYGEIVAQGYLRYLMGVEALVGLILITWSASFLFIEMQKYWTVYKVEKS